MRVRVLHVASAGDLDGGAEYSLLELLDDEQSLGIEPMVLVPRGGTFADEIKHRGVPCIEIPYFQWVEDHSQQVAIRYFKRFVKSCVNEFAELRISRVLRQFKPDLMHINSTAVGVGAKTAGRLGLPVVWHIREFNSPQSGRIFPHPRRQMRQICDADKLIAVSQAVTGEYRDLVRGSKFEIVYDSVISPRPEDVRSKLLSPESDEIRIAVVGTLVPAKGQIVVLQALKILADGGELRFCLDLVGPAPNNRYLEELQSFVSAHGLSKRVRFLGNVGDVYQILREADIQVVSSHSESFGRATVEGMLAGCVMIGADNSGTKELLSEGRGLLYDGTAAHLAEQILRVRAERKIALEVAERGAEFARAMSFGQPSSKKIVEVFKEQAGILRNEAAE